MVKLYKTLVHPIIKYNNVLWGSLYVIYDQKIERIQCKSIRIISSISHLSYHNSQRLKHLNLPSLQYCQKRGDLIHSYQIAT